MTQKLFLYSLVKSTTINLEDKIKLIKVTDKCKTYEVNDNNNIFTVKYNSLDNSCSCNCHFFELFDTCLHIEAVLMSESKGNFDVKVHTLDDMYLNDDNDEHDSEYDSGEATNFDNILDGIDEEELHDFFKEVLFDNPHIYNEFVKRFKGLNYELLKEEFYNTFFEEEYMMSIDDLRRFIMEYYANILHYIKDDNSANIFLDFNTFVLNLIYDCYYDSGLLIPIYRDVLYYLNDLLYMNNISKDLVYEYLINNISLFVVDNIIFSYYYSFLTDNFINKEFIQDLELKINNMLCEYKTLGNYLVLKHLSIIYSDVLKFLNYDESTYLEIMLNYRYNDDIVRDIIFIYLKRQDYKNALKYCCYTDIDDDLIILKIRLFVYYKSRDVNNLKSLFTKLIVEYDYIDNFEYIISLLNKKELDEYINELYNNKLINKDTLMIIASTLNDFNKLFSLVTKDKFGFNFINYANQLVNYNKRSSINYMTDCVRNILSLKNITKEYIDLLFKLFNKLDKIDDTYKICQVLISEIKLLHNKKINKRMEKFINKY